jgi:hypothetical protein
MHYKNLENEKPVRDLVPLSKLAHGIIHMKIFGLTPFWGKSFLRVPVSNLLRFLCVIYIIVNKVF